MRELDFSEKNLRNRWLGVNGIWPPIQDEVKKFVKRRLEQAMDVELTTHVGCNRYERNGDRHWLQQRIKLFLGHRENRKCSTRLYHRMLRL